MVQNGCQDSVVEGPSCVSTVYIHIYIYVFKFRYKHCTAQPPMQTPECGVRGSRKREWPLAFRNQFAVKAKHPHPATKRDPWPTMPLLSSPPAIASGNPDREETQSPLLLVLNRFLCLFWLFILTVHVRQTCGTFQTCTKVFTKLGPGYVSLAESERCRSL